MFSHYAIFIASTSRPYSRNEKDPCLQNQGENTTDSENGQEDIEGGNIPFLLCVSYYLGDVYNFF